MILTRLIAGAALALFLTGCGGFGFHTAPPSEGAVPLVTFVFDDGNDTDYLLAKDIFSREGAVACSAITTGLVNTREHLTPGQIVALRDAGWEIMSHTVTHPHLAWQSPERIDDELKRSKERLAELGTPVTNLVYPFNNNDETVREIAARYYRSARGGTGSLNRGVPDRYFLKSVRMNHDIEEMKEYIDRAAAEKSWLIYYLHEINAKVELSGKEGVFRNGETLRLEPSGCRARYSHTLWAPIYGYIMYLVPLSGSPRPGDTITGIDSGATAHLDAVLYDEPAQLAEMLRYIRTTYPEMRIVTTDQGLDLLGVPREPVGGTGQPPAREKQ